MADRSRDLLSELSSGAPATRRDRWRAAFYITTTTALVGLVVLAVVFDQLAATGVLLVLFLSFILAYLIGPAVELLRRRSGRAWRGRPLPRDLAVLVIYGIIAAVTFPFWTFAGSRIRTATEQMTVLVPQHTARFVGELRASERWYETLRLPAAVESAVGRVTRRVTHDVEGEARALGAELTGIRRLVPWLSTVPVVAFLLITRWRRFRRSTTRVLPTPHLQWRGDELLRNLNSLLAAYTRAQALAGVIVGVLCWAGFAALGFASPGALALAAGLLEMAPLAGPIIVAVVATAMAPGHAAPVLIFLLVLRLVQDYAIYPRLIGRATRLHPLAVVIALWVGAAFGGVVGVCLAIPIVGALQVAWRHWREYRDIERLVAVAGQDPA